MSLDIRHIETAPEHTQRPTGGRSNATGTSDIVLVVNTQKTHRTRDMAPDDMERALRAANPDTSIQVVDVRDLEGLLDDRVTATNPGIHTYAIIGGDGSIQQATDQIMVRKLEGASVLWTFDEGGASEVARMCGAVAFRNSNLRLQALHTAPVYPIRTELFTASTDAEWTNGTRVPNKTFHAVYCLAAGNIAIGSARIDSEGFRELVRGKHELLRRLHEVGTGIAHINIPIDPGIQDIDGRPLNVSSVSYANGSRYGRYGRPGTSLFTHEIVRFDHGRYPPQIWLDVARLAIGHAKTTRIAPGESEILRLTQTTMLQMSGEVYAAQAGFMRVGPSDRATRFVINQRHRRA